MDNDAGDGPVCGYNKCVCNECVKFQGRYWKRSSYQSGQPAFDTTNLGKHKGLFYRFGHGMFNSNDKCAKAAYLNRLAIRHQKNKLAKSAFVAAMQVVNNRHFRGNEDIDRNDTDERTASVAVDSSSVSRSRVVNSNGVGGVNKEYIVKFGTWNVRSLCNATKNLEDEIFDSVKDKRPKDVLPYVVNELVRLELDFLGVQETRLKGEGSVIRKDATLFFSGGDINAKDTMYHGVGILVRSKLLKDVKCVHYVSERMMWLEGCFYGKNMAVVVIYAPTESGYSLEEKVKFYNQLDVLYSSIPKNYDIKVILGDCNARVGEDVEGLWTAVRGRYGSGEEGNENGNLLLEFCLKNELFISNTSFEKKSYGTWYCMADKKYKTIDYCLISLKSKKLLVNAEVNTSAECFSDHFLVQMSIKVSSVVMRKFYKNRVKKLDFSVLKVDNDLRVVIGKEVDEGLRGMQSTGEIVSLPKCMALLSKVCKEKIPVIRTDKKSKEDWFDPHDKILCELMIRRRAARILYLECKSEVVKKCHKRINKQIVKRESVMRNAYWLSVANKIQVSGEKNDSRSMHAASKEVFGQKVCSKENNLKKIGLMKVDGVTLAVTDQEINDRWLEHCKLLFNQNSVVSDSIDSYMGVQKEVDVSLAREFTMKELLVAINSMNFNKAPGNDSLPVEVFCFIESADMLDVILSCFNDALRTGVVDKCLKDVIITTLFKKGDPLLCDNYRTLSLINHIGKVLEKMIQFRLGGYCERIKCLPESQNGFRSDRSTVDAMFVSRLLASSAREKVNNLYKCFVDLTKAYDKVNRDILWKVLQRIGVPDKLIGLIKGLLIGSAAQIRIKGAIVADFSLDMGLKQGSVFSPLLFNIFFGAIIDAWQARLLGKGVPLIFNLKGNFMSVDALRVAAGRQNKCISDLLFADDAEIVASSAEDLQFMLDVFVEVTAAFGQQVSVKKTKVMVVNKRVLSDEELALNAAMKFYVDNQELENVNVFTYVGGRENVFANIKDEVNIRLSRMSAAFALLNVRVFANSNIHLAVKLNIFDSVVIANGLYGCATWNIDKTLMAKLDSWKFRHLKKILRYKWSDYCSYLDIIERINGYGIKIETMATIIRKRRLMYLGHVLRMPDYRLPKIMLHAEVETGRRLQGRQELSYRACIKDDLEQFGIQVTARDQFRFLYSLVNNRNVWKYKVLNGAAEFLDNWKLGEMLESYNRHKVVFMSTWEGAHPPSEAVLEDSWKTKKRGIFWRIEEVEENVTVRRGGRLPRRLLVKNVVNKIKEVVQVPSRVVRLLEVMNKNG